MTFICILVGWIFTLCLHEFSHAYTAYRGGDLTVREKGYLSLNPLRYTHPFYSFLLPLIFVAIGGIALPGGAVYIERDRLRSRGWETAVSLAGPGANLLMAIGLSVGLRAGVRAAPDMVSLWGGLAFFIYLQVMAALLNLLPVPPLDGYGAVEPWLGWRLRAKLQGFKVYGIFIVFALLWFVFPGYFAMAIMAITGLLGVPTDLIRVGASHFFIL